MYQQLKEPGPHFNACALIKQKASYEQKDQNRYKDWISSTGKEWLIPMWISDPCLCDCPRQEQLESLHHWVWHTGNAVVANHLIWETVITR